MDKPGLPAGWPWVVAAVLIAAGGFGWGLLSSPWRNLMADVPATQAVSRPDLATSLPQPHEETPSGASSPMVGSTRPPEQPALQWPVWEYELLAGIPSRESPLTPPPWRFIGAVMTAEGWRLIVLRQGATEPEFYKAGDQLPGGYTIKSIDAEEVTLRAGRRSVAFSYIGSQ